jgi:hypothetical protein
MENFMVGFKRFLSNRNTVTILGVFAIVAILYFGYNSQINKAIQPVPMPYAKDTIQPRTLITADMVGYMNIPKARLRGNVIMDSDKIINNYSHINTVIPAGSLFYNETIVSFSELPDASLIEIEEGLVPYNFRVDMEKTYGNSIFPGNFIHIYFKGYNEEDELMVGRLVENIRVLAVKDRNGRHVFENTEEARIPSILIFAVTEEIHLLLRKASYIKGRDIELIPVPIAGVFETEPGMVEISNTIIEQFIYEHAPDIGEDLPDVEPNLEDED